MWDYSSILKHNRLRRWEWISNLQFVMRVMTYPWLNLIDISKRGATYCKLNRYCIKTNSLMSRNHVTTIDEGNERREYTSSSNIYLYIHISTEITRYQSTHWFLVITSIYTQSIMRFIGILSFICWEFNWLPKWLEIVKARDTEMTICLNLRSTVCPWWPSALRCRDSWCM